MQGHLTSASDDPDDLEALAPNHFLLGRVSPYQHAISAAYFVYIANILKGHLIVIYLYFIFLLIFVE